LSSDELNLFSYEVLGLVGSEGAGPHDLREMVRRGRMLDWAGESRYYVEPKRLAKLGYLSARKAPGKTRERTVYSLTAKGRKALRDYARAPARFIPLKSDALVRLLIADLVGEAATREGLAGLEPELNELETLLDEAAERAAELPHRRAYLEINIAFLRGYLDLHHNLIADVEREFG